MITDNIHSFAIFLYADIQWSHSTEEPIMHAQAGFDAGDGVRHFTINGSRTSSIVDIETTSNIGVPGKYVFRVDDTTIDATPPGEEFKIHRSYFIKYSDYLYYSQHSTTYF